MTAGPGLALVTGAGRAEGLGYGLCAALAARGYRVLLAARDGHAASVLAARLCEEGGVVVPLPLDIADATSVAAAAEHIGSQYGGLRLLINNAGIGNIASGAPRGTRPASADLGAARRMMEVNLFGTWQLSQALLPLLRADGRGRIVNVSSGAGSYGDARFGLAAGNAMGPGYGLSKLALNGLTALLAEELAGSGVLVNAVCPGFTATFEGALAMGARPVAEAVEGILWAAELPDDGPSGGFYRDRVRLPW
ncbi:SDR family NAD(P)-dependent oxidoreductase [Stagnimonas aquatica]|uniref:SDR family NAD(P)-dependent oxidoreductase n=1 Tax=Stagnimonas aquatica TaxID=2689987 RepID=A0A3N0VG84_9GAMM|nr:SDR family NAD(P)-dependent oxidoreductase [Stagnimonas aquatica]ROH91704.1 SDR family NAD(P)-dependent oxidoreductase [Stagnimonas aquatica]